jgi:hypothetical protein
MQLKPIAATVVLLLVVVSLSVAGCASSTNSNQAASSTSQAASNAASTTATTANSTTSAVATATATPTPTPTPSVPTPSPTPTVATTISVWEGYMGMPAEWLDYSTYHVALKPGGSEQVRYVVNAADGTHPCGSANYYIDNQAAGGAWEVTKPQPQYWQGCPGGLPGGAGGLYLYARDTIKFAPGWHTLKIDYLGEGNYAPSEFVASFLVANQRGETNDQQQILTAPHPTKQGLKLVYLIAADPLQLN